MLVWMMLSLPVACSPSFDTVRNPQKNQRLS
jgi:hypothetical protein